MNAPRPLAPEEEALLCLSRTQLDESVTERLEGLIIRGLDWQTMHKGIVSHQIGPLCHRHFDGLDPFVRLLIPSQMKLDLQLDYERSLFRALTHEKELLRIAATLEARGLRFLVVKGLALGWAVYQDIAMRPFDDLDLVVAPDDRAQSSAALYDLGYEQLVTDIASGGSVRAPAGMNQYYVNHLHHSCSFTARVVNETAWMNDLDGTLVQQRAIGPQATTVKVELHHSLVPAGSGHNTDVSGAFERAISVKSMDSVTFWTLSSEDGLVYLAEHQAKHVTHFPLCEWLPLLKWCDIREFVRRYGQVMNWPRVVEIATKAGMRREVFSTLYHTGRLYGEALAPQIEKDISDEEIGFLNEFCYGGYRSRRYAWPMDVGVRVFSGDCGGKALEIVKKRRQANALVECPMVAVAPEFDGCLSHPTWRSAGMLAIRRGRGDGEGPFVLLGEGPQDDECLSATVLVCWDRRHLYVGIKVLDSIVVPSPFRPVGLYSNQDAVLLEFDVDDETVDLKKYVLLPKSGTQDGAVCVRRDSKRGQRLVDGIPLRAVIADGGYVIEMALPHGELGIAPQPGLSIGFDVAIQDCDDAGEGIRAEVSWAGGLLNWGGGELTFR